MKVKDVMTRMPITVVPSTPLDEVARILTENRISGVPVVDDEGHVQGVVTQSDLLLQEKTVPFSTVKAPALFGEWTDANRLEEYYARDAHHHTAADVMTRPVVCINADDDISRASKLMMQHGVGRLPVLHEGKLVGILTRHDLIRSLAQI